MDKQQDEDKDNGELSEKLKQISILTRLWLAVFQPNSSNQIHSFFLRRSSEGYC